MAENTDMPTKSRTQGGAAKPRQFRLTDDEIATMDAIAREIAGDAPVTISRADVFRIGLALAKAKYISDPRPSRR
jgi:hypothetical protein